MELMIVQNFDYAANFMVNLGIEIAEEMGSEKVNTSHILLAAITKFEFIQNFFHDTTGISPQDFRDAVLESYGGNKPTTASPDKFDDDFGRLLTILTRPPVVTRNTEVSVFDLYHWSLLVRESKAHELVARLCTKEDWITDIFKYSKEVFDRTGGKMEKAGQTENEVKVTKEQEDLGILERLPNLAHCSYDMCDTERVEGSDPIELRSDILDSMVETLGRKQKSNPILIGEPGVGKTAIVEGLARRICTGEVPWYLKGAHILNVDISTITSGTRFRGDFEERMNGILAEAASDKRVILFFDEFHMLKGAGGNSGDSGIDAINILKQALSRGDVRIIGATTLAEWHKAIESDKAFKRRLQEIEVKEPSIEEAIQMVKGVQKVYEDFHHCKLSKNVVEQAVKLSSTYLTSQKLPDKAIRVIDAASACAKARFLEKPSARFTVSVKDVKSVITRYSGVDVSKETSVEKRSLSNLEKALKENVIGQDKPLEDLVKAIKRSKAGLKAPGKPVGSFLFIGPTGVGKTETAKQLAIELAGNMSNLIRFDMSEYMEKHSVSKMIGSPPGYVGYGAGGQLTEAVKHRPESVLLFDEIEKAHPDVLNLLLQVLDDGILTDSQGDSVDFKNCIIIMTSNAGYGTFESEPKTLGFLAQDHSDTDVSTEKLTELEKYFRPEFLNRLDSVEVFQELSKESCKKIVGLELKRIGDLLDDKGIKVEWTEGLVDHLIETGYSTKYGARNLKRAIQSEVEDSLSDKLLSKKLSKGTMLTLDWKDTSGLKITEHKVVKEGQENV